MPSVTSRGLASLTMLIILLKTLSQYQPTLKINLSIFYYTLLRVIVSLLFIAVAKSAEKLPLSTYRYPDGQSW